MDKTELLIKLSEAGFCGNEAQAILNSPVWGTIKPHMSKSNEAYQEEQIRKMEASEFMYTEMNRWNQTQQETQREIEQGRMEDSDYWSEQQRNV